MMRPSSGSCTSFCLDCDVKYLARELLCSRALSTRALSVLGEQANGASVGLETHPGFEPGLDGT